MNLRFFLPDTLDNESQHLEQMDYSTDHINERFKSIRNVTLGIADVTNGSYNDPSVGETTTASETPKPVVVVEKENLRHVTSPISPTSPVASSKFGFGERYDTRRPLQIQPAFRPSRPMPVPPISPADSKQLFIEGDKKPSRRVRTTFSTEQKEALELAFEKTQYPDAIQREQIAIRHQIPEARVQVPILF